MVLPFRITSPWPFLSHFRSALQNAIFVLTRFPGNRVSTRDGPRVAKGRRKFLLPFATLGPAPGYFCCYRHIRRKHPTPESCTTAKAEARLGEPPLATGSEWCWSHLDAALKLDAGFYDGGRSLTLMNQERKWARPIMTVYLDLKMHALRYGGDTSEILVCGGGGERKNILLNRL